LIVDDITWRLELADGATGDELQWAETNHLRDVCCQLKRISRERNIFVFAGRLGASSRCTGTDWVGRDATAGCTTLYKSADAVVGISLPRRNGPGSYPRHDQSIEVVSFTVFSSANGYADGRQTRAAYSSKDEKLYNLPL